MAGVGKGFQKKKNKESCTETKNKKKREKKSCTHCKLHGILHLLDTHDNSKQCPTRNCKNFLSEVTIIKKRVMSLQLDVWRRIKSYVPTNTQNKQLCDKCRNHFVCSLKEGHDCPFESCIGTKCRFSEARCLVKAFCLKLERSGVSCSVFQDNYERLVDAQRRSKTTSSYVPTTIGKTRKYKQPSVKPFATTTKSYSIPQNAPQLLPYQQIPKSYSSYLQSAQYSPFNTFQCPQVYHELRYVWPIPTPFTENVTYSKAIFSMQDYENEQSCEVNYGDSCNVHKIRADRFPYGKNMKIGNYISANYEPVSNSFHRPWI